MPLNLSQWCSHGSVWTNLMTTYFRPWVSPQSISAGPLLSLYKLDYKLFSAYHGTVSELGQKLVYAYGHPTLIHYTPIILRHIQNRFLDSKAIPITRLVRTELHQGITNDFYESQHGKGQSETTKQTSR